MSSINHDFDFDTMGISFDIYRPPVAQKGKEAVGCQLEE